MEIAVGGQPVPCRNNFCGTTDIAFAPNGHLFISDGYANARILEYTADGQKIREWGTPGTGPGQFRLPHSIQIDEDGIVYVADRENGRVQRFTQDGAYLGEWAAFGKTFGLKAEPGAMWLATQPRDEPNLSPGWLMKIDRKSGAVLGYVEVTGVHGMDVMPDGELLVLDTIEGLFASLPNESILRSELRRLFRWLKDKGVSAIITAEGGDGKLTRHGLEEYVADCVILLDHRVNEQLSTRRLRVVKYRGSVHGTNEYPFLISKDGFSLLPVTSMGLSHPASSERISSGVERLDTMMGGKGYFRGSSILVSGTAGTGKSSIAAAFVDAACRRGERSLYFAFEESQNQILRNMSSINLNLEPWVKKGLLQFHASRPSLYGLEMHLLTIYDAVKKFKPRVVVMDPVTNLISVGTEIEVRSMLTRLIDFFKTEQVTALFPSLTTTGDSSQSEIAIAALMDVWILLRNIESGGERNRGLYILKSRGMDHSNQIREVLLSNHGIGLVDVYAGPTTVLTGSARIEQVGREKAEADVRKALMDRRQREIERERGVTDAQVAVLKAGLEAKIEELNQEITEETLLDQVNAKSRFNMAANRQADVEPKSQK